MHKTWTWLCSRLQHTKLIVQYTMHNVTVEKKSEYMHKNVSCTNTHWDLADCAYYTTLKTHTLNNSTVWVCFSATKPPKADLNILLEALNTGLVSEMLKTTIHHSKLGWVKSVQFSQFKHPRLKCSSHRDYDRYCCLKSASTLWMSHLYLWCVSESLWIMKTE